MQPGSAQPRRRATWRLPVLVLVVALIVVAVGAVGLSFVRGNGPTPTGSVRPSLAVTSPRTAETGTPVPAVSGVPGESGRPGASVGPPTDSPVGDAHVPLVPVVSFWSTQTDISSANVAAALQGNAPDGGKVVVVDADADAVAAALGVTLDGSIQRAATAATARKAVSKGALGVLRITDVDPSVRALSVDGKALFGEHRVASADDWPMLATLQASANVRWNQGATWTLLAGGDMFMDRGVHRAIVDDGKGIDWPFDGGTAIVTGHHCCGVYVTTHEIPDVQFTGNAGAVRSLVQDADIAMGNLETPVPDNWVYHAHNYIFSSDPALLPMFTNAGIDFVTIANNHIRNFGSSGIADTRKNLAAAGIAFAGAGKSLSEAGEIAYLRAKGTTIGVIGCSGVASSDNATATRAGVLPCTVSAVVPRIQAARQKADLVIVFAHWGREEDNDVQPGQEPIARAWVSAGAGLVLGAHTHVPGAIQQIAGTVVFYSLGNFIFDQSFWTKEMESFLPEMTFEGNRLVQIRMHPYVSPGEQPNLLDPATDDGKAVMEAVRQASQKVGLQW